LGLIEDKKIQQGAIVGGMKDNNVRKAHSAFREVNFQVKLIRLDIDPRVIFQMIRDIYFCQMGYEAVLCIKQGFPYNMAGGETMIIDKDIESGEV
jgi:hypothetical protein